MPWDWGKGGVPRRKQTKSKIDRLNHFTWPKKKRSKIDKLKEWNKVEYDRIHVPLNWPLKYPWFDGEIIRYVRGCFD